MIKHFRLAHKVVSWSFAIVVHTVSDSYLLIRRNICSLRQQEMTRPGRPSSFCKPYELASWGNEEKFMSTPHWQGCYAEMYGDARRLTVSSSDQPSGLGILRGIPHDLAVTLAHRMSPF